MIATRFAVAIHILLLLASGQVRGPATSARLAQSINTNPVVVRRITGQLARAGLIRVRRGPGGAELARPPHAISLGDVWQAVNPGIRRPLLPVHSAPDQACPVGRGVQDVLTRAFDLAEAAMQDELRRTSLDSLLQRLDCPVTPAPMPQWPSPTVHPGP